MVSGRTTDASKLQRSQNRSLPHKAPIGNLNSSNNTQAITGPCSQPYQSGQLGETAGKVQTFLASHRPSSPSSRSRPTTPSPTGTKQQRVNNVEGALHFFAHHGLDANPKLFHCIPAATAAAGVAAAAATDNTCSSNSSSNSNRDGWEPSLYDLQLVPRSQLPPCYCTLTATGIVQVPGNGQPCIHIPIGTWVRDASMYRIFRGMPAFKQVWQGHTIRRWHANVRQLVFQRNRQQLSQRLLLLKPPYLRLLLDCRSKMGSILSAGALLPMPAGQYNLDTMVEQQQEYQLSKLAPLLARTIAAIVTEVENMAARLQSSEQLLRRELQQYDKDPSSGAAQGLSPIKIRAERDAVAAKHATALYDLQRLPNFLRLLGQHVLQSYLDLLVGAVSSLKAHLEAPGNALVVNLLLSQGGVTLSPSMQELLKGLSKGIIEHLVGVLKAAPRPLKHPSLAALLEDPVKSSSIVSAGIAARQRITSCGGCRVSDFGTAAAAAAAAAGLTVGVGVGGGTSGEAAARRISSGSIMAGAAERRISSSNQALQFFHPVAGPGAPALPAGIAIPAPAAVPLPAWLSGSDGEDDQGSGPGGQLLLMMVGDQKLADLRRSMDQQVMRSYREASQVTDTLAELAVLLRFAHMWDPAAYKSKEHSIAQLRKDTLLLREWQAQLQVVLDQQSVGLLQLQTTFLKTTYMTKLTSAQATIAMMLVSAARREAQAAITQLSNLTKELRQQPSKLLEYIAFKLRVKEIWQSKDKVASLRPGQVTDMYNTATAWGGRLPHTDNGLLDDLKEAVGGFSRSLTTAMAFLDSRHAGMVALLDRQARDVLKQVQELLKQLEVAAMAQRLGSTSSGLAVTADKLTAWQQHLRQLTATAASINQQEGQLGSRVTYYADILEAERALRDVCEAYHTEQLEQHQEGAGAGVAASAAVLQSTS